MKPTYEELLAENKWLRENALRTERQVLDVLIQLLLADDKPLVVAKPEAYEYRIYELELTYMMQLADTPESRAAWDSLERVKANYHRAYPDRPLHPKPRPSDAPQLSAGPPLWPAAKPRKPYTRRAPAPATPTIEKHPAL